MDVVVAVTWPGWMALRFGLGFGVAWLAQLALIFALRRRIGAERSTAADLLTLARMTVGSTLAGLVVAGLRGTAGRESVVGWLAWGAALLAASALDWLDGPLARRLGPTRLGGALDILRLVGSESSGTAKTTRRSGDQRYGCWRGCYG